LIRSAESFRGWPHIIDHSLLLLPTFFSSSRKRCHRCDLLCCWWSLLQKPLLGCELFLLMILLLGFELCRWTFFKSLWG
jgi:hypothetical protein